VNDQPKSVLTDEKRQTSVYLSFMTNML